MSNKNTQIWVEKYRPNSILNIINQNEIKQFLEGAIREKNIPHLLLYGPPGTGKTTITNILIKNLYTYKKDDFPEWNKFKFFEENKKLKNDRVLSLNASDERGIKIVREKIKTFANLSIAWHNKDKNIPPFKIIILDEADAMSSDSQFALRRIMEKYSHNTRFILICNYVTKIIPPLASRCSKFRFQSIDYDSSKDTIINILKQEGYNIVLDDSIFTYIYQYTNGDMRKTITLFQRLSYVTNFKNLTIETIRDIIGEIPNDIINNMTTLLENKLDATNITNIYLISKLLITNGYNCLFLINHLYHYFLNCNTITDICKGYIINKLSETDNKLNDGSIEIIQITDLLITINSLINNIDFKYDYNPYTVTI
jgi:replication factor C subunit 2/4